MDSNKIIALLVGLLLLISGVQLFRGKWLFLVAGYNGSILFDVGELHQHLFCIKKYRKDTLKSFRINLATNS
ncbi:hypothetical protein [Enterococcus durans]|uniref:hypothetical protein n=1 Tax=Enterococcus durans TaxID=53345 RepID=UPI00115943F1|nr:hypothetical protein [Enterococcus durans]